MILRFPFTISLNRILLFKIQNEIYGILLANLESVVSLSVDQIQAFEYQQEGKTYSLHYLGSLLQAENQKVQLSRKSSYPVLLFSTTRYPVAFIVDEILYSRELVVQALGGQFKLSNDFSGATILGEGRVVFLLDPFTLSARAHTITTQEKGRFELVERTAKSRDQIWALVVDDSISVRTLTKRILEKHHYNVMTAKDGTEAISQLETQIPDVILLDIDMPKMDGFEFIESIRSIESYKNIPIIIITGQVNRHRKQAEEFKIAHILEKPYQELELLTSIKDLLGITL